MMTSASLTASVCHYVWAQGHDVWDGYAICQFQQKVNLGFSLFTQPHLNLTGQNPTGPSIGLQYEHVSMKWLLLIKYLCQYGLWFRLYFQDVPGCRGSLVQNTVL